MSRGKRYNGEAKLNMKKVLAVVIAMLVIVMFVFVIYKLITNGKGERMTNDYYFTSFQDNKYGVINNKGEEVVTPSYQEYIVIPNNKKDIFLCTYDVDYAKNTYKTKALNSKNKNHGFKEALKKSGLSVISEVKKASPSKGVIAEDFRPVEIAIAYEDAGAAAISCLTEEHYFKGGSKYFADIRAKVDIPMLRKDFIFDEYQIYEAKVLGADAILLIAAILSEEKIKEFYDLAKSLEIDCLVEVHNEKELKKVVACGCDIIGINNRNLKTFDVDLNTTSKLAPLIPYEAVLVSESGMKDENDMKNVKEQGADAVLIGETFMKTQQPGETLQNFLQAIQ